MDRRAQYDQQVRKTRKSSSQTRQPPERTHKETAQPPPHKTQPSGGQQDPARKVNFKHEGFQSQDEMFKYLEETKSQLEKEIHKRLVEQLILKAQGQINTPEQQESLERLYLDLKMINPELAIATLKASAEITSKLNSAPPQQQSQQQQVHQSHSQPPHHPHKSQQQQQQHHHQMQQSQHHHSSQQQSQQQQQQLHRQHSERSSKNPDKNSSLSKTSSGHQALRQRSKSRSKKSSAR